MSWLNELEKIYGTIEKHNRAFGEVQLIRRMARVIRELAKVAKHGSTICDADLDGLYAITCDGTCVGCLRQQALNNLSSDAKAVIEECD